MSDFARFLVTALALTQTASMLMLWIGSRYSAHRYLVRLASVAQRSKLRALERVWPLTRLRVLAERGDAAMCTVILSSLIAIKSAASLAFGFIMVFWLPLASLLVPSIIAVHDPNDPGLQRWVLKVAMLQVTSHGLAAALGFALVVAGPLSGQPLGALVVGHISLVVLTCVGSLGFATAAGRAEAMGLIKRGI